MSTTVNAGVRQASTTVYSIGEDGVGGLGGLGLARQEDWPRLDQSRRRYERAGLTGRTERPSIDCGKWTGTVYNVEEDDISGLDSTSIDDGESELSTGISDDGDEGDQMKVPTRKKKKAGRADISAHCKTQPSKSALSSSSASQPATGTKRDASAAQTSTRAQPQAKKHKHANLVPNTALGTTANATAGKGGTSAPEEGSMVREGGFIRDGETDDVERKSLARMPKDAKVKKPPCDGRARPSLHGSRVQTSAGRPAHGRTYLGNIEPCNRKDGYGWQPVRNTITLPKIT
ncbi:hypothetical protein CPC08DRAFT_730578 [Agrocybe pediades]|nr:hypothetical protein CPC08DRAFT_730578 [Agrocybe pediades]